MTCAACWKPCETDHFIPQGELQAGGALCKTCWEFVVWVNLATGLAGKKGKDRVKAMGGGIEDDPD